MAVVVTGYELCGYSSSVYRDSTGRSPVTVETFCVEPGANSVSFPPPLPAVHLRVPVAPPCGLLAITACSAMVAFPLPGGAGAERCDELGAGRMAGAALCAPARLPEVAGGAARP